MPMIPASDTRDTRELPLRGQVAGSQLPGGCLAWAREFSAARASPAICTRRSGKSWPRADVLVSLASRRSCAPRTIFKALACAEPPERKRINREPAALNGLHGWLHRRHDRRGPQDRHRRHLAAPRRRASRHRCVLHPPHLRRQPPDRHESSTRATTHRARINDKTTPGTTTGPSWMANPKLALCHSKGPPSSEPPHRAKKRVTGQRSYQPQQHRLQDWRVWRCPGRPATIPGAAARPGPGRWGRGWTGSRRPRWREQDQRIVSPLRYCTREMLAAVKAARSSAGRRVGAYQVGETLNGPGREGLSQ